MWRACTLLAAALAAGLALPAAVRAGGEWKKKPPEAWTAEEALEVLTDSPWARTVSVWQLTGRGERKLEERRTEVYQDAPGEPPLVVQGESTTVAATTVEGRYVVQWASARIVQAAGERLRSAGASPAAEMYAPRTPVEPGTVLITVRVAKPPAPPAESLLARGSEAEWRERARLRTSSKRVLAPARAARLGEEKTAAAGAVFLFSRAEALASGVEWVEFVFRNESGDELKVRFKLKGMQAGGKPDY